MASAGEVLLAEEQMGTTPDVEIVMVSVADLLWPRFSLHYVNGSFRSLLTPFFAFFPLLVRPERVRCSLVQLDLDPSVLRRAFIISVSLK